MSWQKCTVWRSPSTGDTFIEGDKRALKEIGGEESVLARRVVELEERVEQLEMANEAWMEDAESAREEAATPPESAVRYVP